MSQISAKVVADSKNEFGNRITTMVVTFPRFILAELNTHRMMSRNSASSRAIPFEKMLESVEKNPFIPIAWQKDHKGMQGTEYISNPDVIEIRKKQWLQARDSSIEQAKLLSKDIEVYTSYQPYSVSKTSATLDGGEGVTKQLCNRLLEPFMWHTVIITATEWENFFALRCPKYSLFSENMPVDFRSKKDFNNYVKQVGDDEYVLTDIGWLEINKGQAEIHMMALAEAMWDAMNESTPKELKAGEWHIPFGDDLQVESFAKENYPNNLEHGDSDLIEQIKIKIATARCARVSYTVVGEEGKEANYENDIKLHDRLAESGHWSPFEHCAEAMTKTDSDGKIEGELVSEWSGNFNGFVQYRKTFQNENIK